ncbi:hypothetical protein MMC13_003499 [Lambiella insularis]|nr:hypothetical protein [Lambiella insularis]
MFRDESEDVVRKARGKRVNESFEETEAVIPVPGDADESASLMATAQLFPRLLDHHAPPATGIEEQGIRFCLSNYLLGPGKPFNFRRGDMSFLQNGTRIPMNKMLVEAITSVGLAGLSNVEDKPSLMVLARSKYASALHMTMEALRDPEELKFNRTLRLVVILAMFEMITCDSDTVKTWTKHLDGAAALIMSRALTGSMHKDDDPMLGQLSYGLFMGSVLREDFDPRTIDVWTGICRKYREELEPPASSLAEIIFQYVRLRQSINKREVTDLTTIVFKLLAIDADLANWAADLPPDWRFFPITRNDDLEDFFEGQAYVYKDFKTNLIWSHFRTCRLLVIDVLLDYLSALPAPSSVTSSLDRDTQRQLCLSVSSQLSREICLSIPHHRSGYYGQTERLRGLSPAVASSFTLLSPLKVAAGTRGASDALCAWATRLLYKLGRTMGIKLALVMVQRVKEQRKKSSELDFAMATRDEAHMVSKTEKEISTSFADQRIC